MRADFELLDVFSWENWFHRIRKNRGLTLRQVKAMSGVSKDDVIVNIEKGRGAGIKNFLRVLEAYGINLVILAGDSFGLDDMEDVLFNGFDKFNQWEPMVLDRGCNVVGMIRAMRVARGVSGERLSLAIGKHESYFKKFENGKSNGERLHFRDFFKILCYLEVRWFFTSGICFYSGDPEIFQQKRFI